MRGVGGERVLLVLYKLIVIKTLQKSAGELLIKNMGNDSIEVLQF